MESKIIKFLVYFFSFLTFGSLFYVIGFILINGISSLSPEMFAWKYTTENVSMMPSILPTFVVVFLALLIAAPIGVFTAFYLVEYADKNNKFVNVIRVATDTLSGIPSIVYGLFGMLFFVIFLGFKYSIISGVLTSVIMVLPVIIRSTEEALLAVRNSLREGSFALGAGKLRTIFRVVLPVAMPGILSGIILAVGRIVGETAALMYTLGTSVNVPDNLFQSSRTLALHMYILASEGIHVRESYATGVVLIVIVLIINGISTWLSNRLTKGAK